MHKLHHDVLDVNPKGNKIPPLVEELKHRAKHAFKAHQFDVCDALYSKCISIDEKTAEHYSNRCLVYIKLQYYDEALADANTMVKLMGKSVSDKAYYRLGCVLICLNKQEQAWKTFEMAHTVNPNNKTIADLLKTRKVPPQYAQPPPQRHKQIHNSTRKKNEKLKRGYKIVDGKKTTFFDHTQTQQDKELIGDITPKAISSVASNKRLLNEPSMWNSGGTWEEQNITALAMQLLLDIYVNATDITGDASIIHSRLKTKIAFNFNFKWKGFQIEISNHIYEIVENSNAILCDEVSELGSTFEEKLQIMYLD